MRKFIGITGYGNSGKSAVSDYLKQFDYVFSFPNHVEFELMRVPGGLLDLYTSIYFPYNSIRTQKRIQEFKQLVKRIGRVQCLKDPISYWTASGHNYNRLFNNCFFDISEKYINSIVESKIPSFWPYKNLQVTPYKLFKNKVKAKLFNYIVSEDIAYTDRNNFLELTVKYIQDLFAEVATPKQTHIILNNSFEPYNPTPYMDMVGDGVSIIVERDLRDIYANLIDKNNIYTPDGENYKNTEKIKKKLTAYDNINQFIYRYKNLRNNVVVDPSSEKDVRILRIRYEDFILNHENVSSVIKKFIQLPTDAQVVQQYFDVNKSKKNVGVWKKYTHLKEIQLIEKELAEYCYQN